MALIKCKECGNEVSSKAEKCPHCGVTVKEKTSGCAWLFLILIIFMLYSAAVNAPSLTPTAEAPPPIAPKSSAPQNEWYEGGTLQKATMKEWSSASYENRLATSADFVASSLKADGQKPLSMDQFKLMSIDFEREISEANMGGVDDNQRAAEVAAALWITMHTK
jgi:hypothetical protein